jgi:serine/threonine protein kinase
VSGKQFDLKSDIWALGVILLELYLGEAALTKIIIDSGNLFSGELELHLLYPSLLQNEAFRAEIFSHFENDSSIQDVISAMLNPDPNKRPSALEILSNRFFDDHIPENSDFYIPFPYLPIQVQETQSNIYSPFSKFSSHQILHLWLLVGGRFQLQNLLDQQDESSPIEQLPVFASANGDVTLYEKEISIEPIINTEIKRVDAFALLQNVLISEGGSNLNELPSSTNSQEMNWRHVVPWTRANVELELDQPLLAVIDQTAPRIVQQWNNIRERDVMYQFKRMAMFLDLLHTYPDHNSVKRIKQEAIFDIPSVYMTSDLTAATKGQDMVCLIGYSR